MTALSSQWPCLYSNLSELSRSYGRGTAFFVYDVLFLLSRVFSHNCAAVGRDARRAAGRAAAAWLAEQPRPMSLREKALLRTRGAAGVAQDNTTRVRWSSLCRHADAVHVVICCNGSRSPDAVTSEGNSRRRGRVVMIDHPTPPFWLGVGHSSHRLPLKNMVTGGTTEKRDGTGLPHHVVLVPNNAASLFKCW